MGAIQIVLLMLVGIIGLSFAVIMGAIAIKRQNKLDGTVGWLQKPPKD